MEVYSLHSKVWWPGEVAETSVDGDANYLKVRYATNEQHCSKVMYVGSDYLRRASQQSLQQRISNSNGLSRMPSSNASQSQRQQPSFSHGQPSTVEDEDGTEEQLVHPSSGVFPTGGRANHYTAALSHRSSGPAQASTLSNRQSLVSGCNSSVCDCSCPDGSEDEGDRSELVGVGRVGSVAEAPRSSQHSIPSQRFPSNGAAAEQFRTTSHQTTRSQRLSGGSAEELRRSQPSSHTSLRGTSAAVSNGAAGALLDEDNATEEVVNGAEVVKAESCSMRSGASQKSSSQRSPSGSRRSLGEDKTSEKWSLVSGGGMVSSRQPSQQNQKHTSGYVDGGAQSTRGSALSSSLRQQQTLTQSVHGSSFSGSVRRSPRDHDSEQTHFVSVLNPEMMERVRSVRSGQGTVNGASRGASKVPDTIEDVDVPEECDGTEVLTPENPDPSEMSLHSHSASGRGSAASLSSRSIKQRALQDGDASETASVAALRASRRDCDSSVGSRASRRTKITEIDGRDRDAYWFVKWGFDEEGAYVAVLHPDAPKDHQLLLGDGLRAINHREVGGLEMDEIRRVWGEEVQRTGKLQLSFEEAEDMQSEA